MPRPPIGPIAMQDTVKFRLTRGERAMLEEISRDVSVSVTLRNLIHDEYKRTVGGTR